MDKTPVVWQEIYNSEVILFNITWTNIWNFEGLWYTVLIAYIWGAFHIKHKNYKSVIDLLRIVFNSCISIKIVFLYNN